MSKHTPTPWLLVEVALHWNIISEAANGDLSPVASDVYNPADADLIAASPLLLEACKQAVIALRFYAADMQATHATTNPDGQRSYPFGLDAERECRAAIAAAEGGEA